MRYSKQLFDLSEFEEIKGPEQSKKKTWEEYTAEIDKLTKEAAEARKRAQQLLNEYYSKQK